MGKGDSAFTGILTEVGSRAEVGIAVGYAVRAGALAGAGGVFRTGGGSAVWVMAVTSVR